MEEIVGGGVDAVGAAQKVCKVRRRVEAGSSETARLCPLEVERREISIGCCWGLAAATGERHWSCIETSDWEAYGADARGKSKSSSASAS